MVEAQVLILFAALSTCDPGNVLDAVKAAKQSSVRVSVVGVAAEVHICKVFTQVWMSPLLQTLLCTRSSIMVLVGSSAHGSWLDLNLDLSMLFHKAV